MEYKSNIMRIGRHENLTFYAHTHAEYEIIAVTEGCMTVCVDQTDIIVNSGNAIFLPPFYVHSFRTEKHSVCHIWEFSSKLVPEELPQDIVIFPITKDETDFIYHTTPIDDMIICKATVYRILSFLTKPATNKRYIQVNDVCSAAVRFIAENFHEQITLCDAAHFLNVNYSYLSRMFKKHQGISFTECLNGTRLNNAVTLLCKTDRTVADIALDCGFGSVRNFNRFFYLKMKCTPQYFRENQSSSL